MLDFAFAIAYFVALVLLWIFSLDKAQFVWRGSQSRVDWGSASIVCRSEDEEENPGI